VRLLGVTFHNFKKLANANLKFEDRITVLVGQNESGKSTILDGLYKSFDHNKTQSLSRYYSKLRDKQEFEVRVTIKLDKNDIIDLLSKAGLDYLSKDDYFAGQQYIFAWSGHATREDKNIQSKWKDLRQRYGDNKRYDLIINLMKRHLIEDVLLIRPNNIINTIEEYIDSFVRIPYQGNFPLNYLYSLKIDEPDSFSIIKKNVQQFLKNTDFDIIKKGSNLEISIIKLFRGQEKQLNFDEMSDGAKKILSILIRTFVYNPKILILDEPDSSLHSNLVRSLTTHLKSLKMQILIASHNEILLNEFNPKEIRYVYSISAISSKIKEYARPDLNQIFVDLGLNLKYKKSLLLSSELILLMEGDDDIDYFYKLLDKSRQVDRIKNFNVVPETTGGNKIIDLDIIDKLNRSPIPVLLVRDGDEMEEKQKNRVASEHGNRIHFWRRREIENYVLSTAAILNAIKAKVDSSQTANIKSSDIDDLLEKIGLSLVNKIAIMTIYSRYKRTYLSEDRSKISEFINKYENKSDADIRSAFMSEFIYPAQKRFESIGDEFNNIKKNLERKIKQDKRTIEVSPGKELIKQVSEWCKSNYGVEITFKDLLDNIPLSDIDPDFKSLVDKIVANCSTARHKYLETFEEVPNDIIKLNYRRSITNNSDKLVIAAYEKKIFLAGNIGIGSGRYTPYKDLLAVGDYTCRDIKFKIPLNESANIIRSSIYDIKFESNSNTLLAVAEVHLQKPQENFQTATTTLLITDINNGDITRLSYSDEPSGEKEGNADQLELFMDDSEKGTIFFSMIYFNGGSGLYTVKYNFKTRKIISTEQHKGYTEHFRDPGPRSLFVDTKEGKLYFLVNYDQGPYVFTLCCKSNKIIEKMAIPVNNKSPDGSFTSDLSHDKHAIALNYTNGHLFVIENTMIYDLDPLNKTVKKMKSDIQFKYVVSNPHSKRTYFIISERDDDAENPYSYSLYTINGQSFKLLFKFDNEITINDIVVNENYNCLYVMAQHNDIENEHSLWKFDEVIGQ